MEAFFVCYDKSMNIRNMTLEDLPAVISLGNDAPELAVSDESRFWSEPRLRSWVEAGQDILLVAEENGEVIAFQLTQLHLPSKVGYLSDIVVKERARGRGVGAALTEETVKRMKDMGLTYIYALTQEANDGIQNLLKKEGFEAGETMVWFEKKS